MFTTIEQVKNLTGKEVTQERIIMAQAILESYVGRVEAEVINANDQALLGHATAYQVAYMEDDADNVFTQAATTQISQFGTLVSFRQDGASPWVAPLAILACSRLTFTGSRSVKTGGIFSSPMVPSGWTKE